MTRFLLGLHLLFPCDTRFDRMKNLVSHILTAKDLYDWAVKSMKEITPLWLPSEGLDKVMPLLEERFDRALPIPQTRQWHRYVPLDDLNLQIFATSESIAYKIFHTVKPSVTGK